VRVLEVASHVFVPIGGGVLTGQGAEVIKIEHPEGGDPYRGLVTAGLHKTFNGIDAWRSAGRGQRLSGRRRDGRRLLAHPRQRVV
jgi:crotonobetainyl-CoA:carnitine CoA-transferase CaiB-like acyl-CoA transferase